jgi:hypothetical protein
LAGTAAFLAGSGFVAFAAGEAMEGRAPLGTWATAAGIFAAAFAVAALSRAIARWLAAGGSVLAAIIASFVLGAARPQAVAVRRRPVAQRRADFHGSRRGRAPPPFA